MVKAKRIVKNGSGQVEVNQLVEAVVQGIKEKKGHEIVILDLRSTGSSLTDFFVVCHGDSTIQVEAIAHSVENEVIKIQGESPVFKEGYSNAEWVLLDYINVVVHIFNAEQREYYGIERFWADAQIRRIA